MRRQIATLALLLCALIATTCQARAEPLAASAGLATQRTSAARKHLRSVVIAAEEERGGVRALLQASTPPPPPPPPFFTFPALPPTPPPFFLVSPPPPPAEEPPLPSVQETSRGAEESSGAELSAESAEDSAQEGSEESSSAEVSHNVEPPAPLPVGRRLLGLTRSRV